jgi:hypothetical protein
MLLKGSLEGLRRFLNHSGVSSLSEDKQITTYNWDFQSNKFIVTNIIDWMLARNGLNTTSLKEFS